MSFAIPVAFGLGLLLPRLIRRGGKKNDRPAEEAGQQASVQTSSGSAAVNTQGRNQPNELTLKPFGSPQMLNSPQDQPATPTSSKGADTKEHDNDVDRSKKDQVSVDAAAMLKVVDELQAENAKLRAFMQEHMQTSAKMAQLEEENKTLASMKSKLEGEVQDLKDKTSPFVLHSGDELQRFKGMLAGRVPLEARSVCSDAEGVFGMRDTASVDGAATVADFAAVRKRAPGFFAELANLLMISPTPSTKAARTAAGSTAGSVKSAKGTTSALPGASNNSTSGKAAATSKTDASPKVAKTAVDVGSLLDGWASGGRMY